MIQSIKDSGRKCVLVTNESLFQRVIKQTHRFVWKKWKNWKPGKKGRANHAVPERSHVMPRTFQVNQSWNSVASKFEETDCQNIFQTLLSKEQLHLFFR